MTHYYSEKPRRGPRRLISAHLRGVTLEFYTAPGVFSPDRVDEGTRLLVENAVVRPGDTVLDMGCGYGVIGIAIARSVPRTRVYMVDINRAAVKLARQNARLNGVEDRVTVLHGNLYEPVEGLRFDAILSNPPLTAGLDVVDRIILEAPRHLRRSGSLQIVVSRAHEHVASLMDKTFGAHKTLASKKGYKVYIARIE
jgi:16S rRNA (guanine1207-N2)-methyltransferase